MSRDLTLSLERMGPALDEVRKELMFAIAEYEPFHSAHEGYATLLEEMEELWDEVKLNPRKRDLAALRLEAKQTAAMAIRIMMDCTHQEK